ncbi:MAG: hypothetical protein H6553_11045 [Chitinophagales bacterium]|nr:hypothetical protein [Chitinophagales bacterium]
MDWFTHLRNGWGQDILFINDLLLIIPFLLIVHFFLKKHVQKQTNPIYQKYFLKGWYVRVFGAVMSALMYQYYYHGGDTMSYFKVMLWLRKFTFTDFNVIIDTFFNTSNPNYNNILYQYFGGYYSYLIEDGTRTVILIGYVLSFFCLNTYILISLLFTMFAYYGFWKLFKLFYKLYPHLEKEIAISCLFIPSVFFWGTGLMKEPLCIGALGVLTYSTYELFINKNIKIKYIIALLLSVLLVKTIKVYIILAFVPALSLWVFAKYALTIQNKIVKVFIAPILIVIGSGIGLLMLSQMASVAERYSFEQLMRTAKDTQNWLVYSSEQQDASLYTLGDLEYTTMGLIKVFPKAVNVALFRPYIWEARKPTLFIAAIEAVATLYFTLMLFFRQGPIKVFKNVFSNPDVLFCFTFSIIFAFAVGFTSFNFGALARYKIPMMPFYFIGLTILYSVDATKKPENTT